MNDTKPKDPMEDYANLKFHPEGGGRLYVVGCAYCERERMTGNDFFPSHVPSGGCRSGKRPHCTCDSCW